MHAWNFMRTNFTSTDIRSYDSPDDIAMARFAVEIFMGALSVERATSLRYDLSPDARGLLWPTYMGKNTRRYVSTCNCCAPKDRILGSNGRFERGVLSLNVDAGHWPLHC